MKLVRNPSRSSASDAPKRGGAGESAMVESLERRELMSGTLFSSTISGDAPQLFGGGGIYLTAPARTLVSPLGA